jgi:hypothetical protein
MNQAPVYDPMTPLTKPEERWLLNFRRSKTVV